MRAASPFNYGNPIDDPERFFGRRREVEQIFSRLRNPAFESTSIVGERRTGKTSLLNFVSHPSIAAHYGLDPRTYCFCYIDLQMMDAVEGVSHLYQQILQRLREATPDTEIKEKIQELLAQETIDNYDLDAFFDLVDDLDYHVVLLFDEFEHLSTNESIGPEVYYGLRSMAIHHNLAYLTASRKDLVDLSRTEDIRSSPFFNIFANIWLPPFSTEDVADLLKGLLASTTTQFTDHEIHEVRALSGRHPFFLQMACSFLFDTYQDQVPEQERAASLATRFREEAAPHLKHFWQVSDDPERIVLIILAILQGRAQESTAGELAQFYVRAESVLASLSRRGLVSTSDGIVQLLTTAFGEWIREELLSVAGETETFDQWREGKQDLVNRIPEGSRNRASEVLERVPSRYRGMISSWLADPKTALQVVGLISDIQRT